ncbi:hypothetical protein AVEN_118103-1, partial [Araneus ventricosus]
INYPFQQSQLSSNGVNEKLPHCFCACAAEGNWYFAKKSTLKLDIHRSSTPRFLEHRKAKPSVSEKSRGKLAQIDGAVGIETNLISIGMEGHKMKYDSSIRR